jgi:hypothetical protein
MAACATGLQVGFVIRLYSITFAAFVTYPLLFGAMLSTEVFFDTN